MNGIEKKKIIRKIKKQVKGITLVSLVVTIIILLILAGVTLSLTIGENGIIKKALEAVKQTEIAGEKEIVQISAFESQMKNDKMILVEEEFQNAMDNNTSEGETEVADVGDEFEVIFWEKNRYYTVDKDGQLIGGGEIIEDENPGDITTGKDGEELDGSEEHPYEIWCIEDLVAFSNMVNGEGYIYENEELKQVKETNGFTGKYITLKKDLNFKSTTSYADSKRTEFGDINGVEEDGNELMNEMLTGSGFSPIGTKENPFTGNFDGECNEINQIYISIFSEEEKSYAGLFGHISYKSNILNLGISGNITINNGTAGGIVGIKSGGNTQENGNIENCYNKATVTATGGTTIYWTGNGVAGGIIGVSQQCVLSNCYNLGTIRGEMSAGGIAGKSGEKFINCYNNGEIISTGETSNDSYAGGILGGIYARNIKIINCYNNGNIRAKKVCAGIFGGGVAGSAEISNCYNSGMLENANIMKPISSYETRIEKSYYLHRNGITGQGIELTDEELKNKVEVKEINKYIIDILNSNVKEINDLINEEEIKLKYWKVEGSYPIFNL